MNRNFNSSLFSVCAMRFASGAWIGKVAICCAIIASSISFGQQCQPDEILKMRPDDPESSVYVEGEMAITGNLLLVCDPYNNEFGDYAGAVYAFDVTTGEQVAKIHADNLIRRSMFGTDIEVSDVDPDLVAIGASGQFSTGSESGAVYLSDVRTGQQLAQFHGSQTSHDDHFGGSLSICNHRLLVGAPGAQNREIGSGEAYLFDLATREEIVRFPPPADQQKAAFGAEVKLVNDYAIISAPSLDVTKKNSGMVYVFDVQTFKLKYQLFAPDGRFNASFGTALAVWGDYLIVGAPGQSVNEYESGAVYVFDLSTGSIVYKLHPSVGSSTGQYGLDLAVSGDFLFVGSPRDTEYGYNAGAVFVVDLRTGEEVLKLTPSDAGAQQNFGDELLVRDGTLFVVAPNISTIYEFEMNCTNPYIGSLEVEPYPLKSWANARFVVDGALPDEQTWLAYSFHGVGPVYVPFLDLNVNLKAPRTAGRPKMTDASGHVEWQLFVPPGASGEHVAIQALQHRNKTNVVSSPVGR